jgi:rod shape-determining protein MreC
VNNKRLFSKSTSVGFRALLLVVLALILVFFDRYSSSLSFIKTTCESILTPLQYLVHYPVVVVENLTANITNKLTLADENAALRAELIILQAKVQKMMALEQENIKLQGLVKAGALATKEKFLIAKILAVNVNNFNHEVLLDKGKSDGLYVGQPVLDAYGVVGQVISVGLSSSLVLLITDIKSGVPVKVARNGSRAILVGTGDIDRLELVQIPEIFDIKKGDLLVTSDLGSRFPDGYPIGEVVNVDRVLGERSLKVGVVPTAKINQDRQILLIWSYQIPVKASHQKRKVHE